MGIWGGPATSNLKPMFERLNEVMDYLACALPRYSEPLRKGECRTMQAKDHLAAYPCFDTSQMGL